MFYLIGFELVNVRSLNCLFIVNILVFFCDIGRMENVFSGNFFILCRIFFRMSVESGVLLVGFNMKGYFIVIVGVILCVIRLSGKFYGFIMDIGLIGNFLMIFCNGRFIILSCVVEIYFGDEFI